ncbi:hypothetical protein Q5752_001561 [Cryptotrichosporon argae]
MLKSHPIDLPHPWSHSESPHADFTTRLKAALPSPPSPPPASRYPAVEPYGASVEDTPLLRRAGEQARRGWWYLGWARRGVAGFLNPPMAGGLLAVVAGVIPFTHSSLFDEGAWASPFSQSIQNLGKLYAVLQMFVLGAHLQSKKGSRPPIPPLVYLFVFRFLVMPVISTGVVYGVRVWLGDRVYEDPILDFVMAIAPVGPPALTLAAIVEMSDADESTTTAVAKTIVLSYALTPLISLSVTGAQSVVGALYK